MVVNPGGGLASQKWGAMLQSLCGLLGCPAHPYQVSPSICETLKRENFITHHQLVRRGIWDHSFLLRISLADGHYALVAPIV